MIRCPNLRDDKVREDFNVILARLGGLKMTAGDISPRQAYLGRLDEAQTRAYHIAHYLWNAHKTPAEASKFLDALDATKAALEKSGDTRIPGVDEMRRQHIAGIQEGSNLEGMKPPAPEMYLEIGDKRYHVADYKEASEKVSAAGNELERQGGNPSKDFQSPAIVDSNGKVIAHVSWNGRVWPGRPGRPGDPGDWAPGTKPLYDPRSVKAPETGPSPFQGDVDLKGNTPAIALAEALVKRVEAGKPITAKMLQDEAARAYGGTLAEGKFDRKDAQDALELAVNMYIRDNPALRVDRGRGSFQDALSAVSKLDQLLTRLPTQRVRSEEQERLQQFSTPPTYAAAAAFVANLRDGDLMLEPSAGTGSLVAASSKPGVKIIANELSERRAALLKYLIGKDGEVFTENAEQLANTLPETVKPTVVVMNPPFSQTAGRMGDRKVPMVAAEHISQALEVLQPGGRLVAIVGRGMTMGQPSYRAWWSKIGKEYSVRANIGVDGKVYEKYGTTFGTRLLVIDKVTPEAGDKPVLADVTSADELMRALEPIRNARPEAEQQRTQSRGAALAQGNEGAGAGPLPASPQPGARRPANAEGGERGLAAPGTGSAEGATRQPVRVEGGERAGVASDQSERPGQGGAGKEPARPGGEREPAGGRGEARPQRDLEPAGGGQPGTTASTDRIELAHAEPGSQGASEISESLYDAYQPQRVRVPGAKRHPSKLVESAAMASVPPPKPEYRPHLPRKVIDKGLLSDAQLEAVIYAGEAHGEMLPAQKDDVAKRKGYFIGDGTGVGKGREVAGIILDNWTQGRKKAVWVSEKRPLLQDARRDWSGLEQNSDLIFDAGKVKTGEPIQAKEGIGFITYDTLKGGMSDQRALARGQFVRKQQVSVNGQSGKIAKIEQSKSTPDQITVDLDNGTRVTVPANEVQKQEDAVVKSRIDQLVDWFGKDFDGVIAFDEAHNMGNATDIKGERGQKTASQKAIAGVQLQDRLPNARVVYVSATGATEVSNLSYADRLGLWGRGTPFASREKFVTEVDKGGIAAMELIARDMKQLGLYTARNLSYDGVEYERLEHTLDNNQREIYDTLAEAWQVVLRNINEALKATEADKDGRAKSAALSAFWGGHQRFFNQIVTSMQMPSVIKAVEKDIAAGHQAVLQLTNTNEASQERAAAKAKSAEEIEDLDITPRDQIIQLVENSFPTQQYEKYIDDNGKERSRPVVDSKGEPVQNRKAIAMREALIERLASVRVPQGPLDLVLDHFGTDVVAEVTGRGRRFVRKPDEKTGQMKRVEENRPGSSNIAETDAFQNGDKKVLVFSEAGGTGRSYHADKTAKSKDARRAHYLVQGGWRADKAVQGFGRTHRSNQQSEPIFKLVTTDLKGQKRFISSIARRLGQLGALTKGQRQAGDQGVFSARDNLESIEATTALRQFFADLMRGTVKDIEIGDFEEQTGLKLRSQDDEGRVSSNLQKLPPITQFLNRLLSLKIDLQNKVFDAFSERLDAVIEARREAGLLDVGLETVKADKIAKDSEQTVHTVKGSGAETKHVKLTLSDKFEPTDFNKVANNEWRKVVKWVESPNGKVYAVAEAPSLTDEAGKIVDNYRLVSPVSDSRLVPRDNLDQPGKKWKAIDKGEARERWQNEIDAAPKYVTRDLHLITGAILPIWDRLKGNPRVVRLQTDKGERFIGRVIPNSLVAQTLKALGAEMKGAKQLDPKGLFSALMSGSRATLANGWTLKRSLVAGEHRIELKGPTSFSEGQEAKKDGAFTEKIDYRLRYFVPTEPEQGAEVLRKLTEYRPVSEVTDAGSAPQDMAAGDDGLGFGSGGVRKSPRFTEFPAPRLEKHDIGRQAQDLVLENGRRENVEYLLAVDGNGDVLSWGHGDDHFVGMSPELFAAVRDKSQAVVIHHNHPNNAVISRADFAMLAYPGLKAVWAHGHNGTISRAELTQRAAQHFAGRAEPPKVELYEIAKGIGNFIYSTIQTAVSFNKIEADAAGKLDAYLIGEVMRRAGIVDFRSNFDDTATIEKLGLEPHIKRAVEWAARKLFGDEAEATDVDRRAEPLRHPADLGASFERSARAAGEHRPEAATDRDRPPDDREEDSGLKSGLAEDAPRYAAEPQPTPNLNRRIRERIERVFEQLRPMGRKFIEGAQDLSHPVKLLQDELEKRQRGAFDDPESFYVRKRLYPGRLGAWTQTFNARYLDPMVRLLKGNGISLQQASDYLYALHAPERNEAMSKINPGLAGEGSGMSNEEAAKIIAAAKRSGNAAAFEDLRAQVGKIRDLILDVMEQAGLEKPEVIAEWKKKYDDYVPLRGWEVEPANAPGEYRGPAAGFNIRGKEVKQAFGRRSKADNPLVNLLDQAYRTFDRAERNRYLQSLYRAIDTVGEDAHDIATLDRGQPKKGIDPKTGLVRTIENSANYFNPKAVYLKFNGNPHFIVFKDQELAEAAKRMSPDPLNGILRGLLNLQNKMKALWTHYSPDFLVRHFLFRYPIEGTLNSFEQKESGEHKVSQYIKDALPFMGNASKAIFADQKGALHDDPKIAEMQKFYAQLKRAGGAMVFRNMRDTDLLKEHLQTALKDLSNSRIANGRAKWRHAIEAMDKVTNALDNSLRLAAAFSAHKQGKSLQQAALIAREATVDFQLKGRWSYHIGLWLIFNNVATQTAARMVKAFIRSKIMRRVFMGTMMTGFLTAAFNYLVGGNDKDGIPFFEKIPERDRRLNFIILNPWDTDAKGRPQPIKIPMPYNWALPLSLGYAFGTKIFGKEDVRKTLSMVTKALLESLTPLGSEQNKAAMAAPEIVRPLMHVYTNEDWEGRPIHMDPRFQKHPNAYSGRKTTGEGWQKIAKGVNTMTGGSAGKSGMIDLYPEDYRELIEHFVGTQIRLGANLADVGTAIAKGEVPPATKTPLARVVHGTDYDAADRARGYEMRDKRLHPWKQ